MPPGAVSDLPQRTSGRCPQGGRGPRGERKETHSICHDVRVFMRRRERAVVRADCVPGTEGSGLVPKAPSHRDAPLTPGSLSSKADFSISEAPFRAGGQERHPIRLSLLPGQAVDECPRLPTLGRGSTWNPGGPDATGHMVSEHGWAGALSGQDTHPHFPGSELKTGVSLEPTRARGACEDQWHGAWSSGC